MKVLKPCATWAEKLAARHPNDLLARERSELEAHVATCAACAAVQIQYEAITQRVRDASATHAFAMPEMAFLYSTSTVAASEEVLPVPGVITRRHATHSRRFFGHSRPTAAVVMKQLACVAVLACVLLASVSIFLHDSTPSTTTAGGGVSSGKTVFPRDGVFQREPYPIPETNQPIPAEGYSVVGKPSMSVEQINKVLAYYHSPATGKGQAIYDLGVQYQVDPAFALAMFMRESSFGTKGEARQTRSPGNLRCIPGYLCVDQDRGGYASFASWEDGFAVWYKLIHDLYVTQNKLTTVNQIISLYAPTEEAEYQQDIAFINHEMALWRSGKVHP